VFRPAASLLDRHSRREGAAALARLLDDVVSSRQRVSAGADT
jgi:hypothetical protein